MDTGKSLNKCTFTQFSCGAKSVSKVVLTPCGSNVAENVCNAEARCIWKKATAATTGNEGSGAECVDITCSGYTTSADCTQTTAGVNKFCAWDATAKTCSKKVAKKVVCNTILKKNECPSS
jgi:hypothetical protein